MSRLVLFIDFLVESRIRCLSYGKEKESARSRAGQVGRLKRREKTRREAVAGATSGNSAKGNFDSMGEKEEEFKRPARIAWIVVPGGDVLDTVEL